MSVSESERMGMLLSLILVRVMMLGEETLWVMVVEVEVEVDDEWESLRGAGGEFMREGWGGATVCGVGVIGSGDSVVFEGEKKGGKERKKERGKNVKCLN